MRPFSQQNQFKKVDFIIQSSRIWVHQKKYERGSNMETVEMYYAALSLFEEIKKIKQQKKISKKMKKAK